MCDAPPAPADEAQGRPPRLVLRTPRAPKAAAPDLSTAAAQDQRSSSQGRSPDEEGTPKLLTPEMALGALPVIADPDEEVEMESVKECHQDGEAGDA